MNISGPAPFPEPGMGFGIGAAGDELLADLGWVESVDADAGTMTVRCLSYEDGSPLGEPVSWNVEDWRARAVVTAWPRGRERWVWTDEGCDPGIWVLVLAGKDPLDPHAVQRGFIIASVKPMRDGRRYKPWMRLPRGPGGASRWCRGQWQCDVPTAASHAENVLVRVGVVTLREFVDRSRLEGYLG